MPPDLYFDIYYSAVFMLLFFVVVIIILLVINSPSDDSNNEKFTSFRDSIYRDKGSSDAESSNKEPPA